MNDEDPYQHRLTEPEWACVHGNGSNCECQLPIYRGLFVWALTDDDGRVRHIVSRMQQSHDGGMRQFLSPDDRTQIDGSCGANWANANVKSLSDFRESRGR